MKTKLITALRTAANALDRGTFSYAWHNPEGCNCGVLVCSIMGLSVRDLRHKLNEDEDWPNIWSHAVREYCPVTGIPTHEIFKALFATGLTAQDILELEYLANPKIRSRAQNWKPTSAFTADYRRKENAAAYMRAWADILTEEGAADVAEREKAKTSHSKP